MRFSILIFITAILLVLGSSCRKDLEYAPSEGNLEFSKDTVFLDTIFANNSSGTYVLKIYNRNRDDLEIPSIRLAKGQSSAYRLNVDGIAGKEFSNIPILAQDSLYVFIEATVPASNTNVSFLYTDVIEFDSGADLQEVPLVTMVRDAIFLFPKTLADGTKETIPFGLDSEGNEIQVEGFTLEDDMLQFTNEKPYVIYGYAEVPSGKALIFDAGARVHFHKDAGILVRSNATIKVNGMLSEDQNKLENEVIFASDRLQSEFSNTPGQWGTIFISPGSTNNTVNYLTIKNATVGLLVEGDGQLQSPTLEIKNSQIYNSATANLWSKTAYINGENLVLGSAGNTSLYCSLGGRYSFTHCTIANYWSNGFRNGTALKIDNFDSETEQDLIAANFTNCIIDGNNFIELNLQNNGVNAFDYGFQNCILKFRDDNDRFGDDPLYDFEDPEFFDQVLLNQNSDFQDTSENNYQIGSLSAAIGNAKLEDALLIPFDIIGKDRTAEPAIGAYQRSQ